MDGLLHRYMLNPIKVEETDDNCFSAVEKIKASLIDTADELIVNACINAAKEEGITRLYLLDRNFLIDAIKEKMDRDFPEYTDDEVNWF